MNNLIKKYHQPIQKIKNNLTQEYFKFRINNNSNPYQINFRKKPYKIIFILSHMRSGSSLLTHLLVSNPDIMGFGESHLQYESEWDFKRLMMRIYWQHQEFSKFPEHFYKFKMNHQYILDKVLHDNKFINDDFLTSKQVYVIFLLRNPEQTIPSLLDLKPHWNEENAYNYYTERLLSLQKYAEKINDSNKCLLLTYHQLLDNTNSALLSLQNFLQTSQEFSEEYTILNTTGKKNIGDYKGNIKAGKIIRNQRKIDLKIDQFLLEKAKEIYDNSYEQLAKFSQIIN